MEMMSLWKMWWFYLMNRAVGEWLNTYMTHLLSWDQESFLSGWSHIYNVCLSPLEKQPVLHVAGSIARMLSIVWLGKLFRRAGRCSKWQDWTWVAQVPQDFTKLSRWWGPNEGSVFLMFRRCKRHEVDSPVCGTGLEPPWQFPHDRNQATTIGPICRRLVTSMGST